MQVLDMSENPMGINGAKVLADLLDPSQTSVQFLVELHINKVWSSRPWCDSQSCGYTCMYEWRD
jgi:hypothetical protein